MDTEVRKGSSPRHVLSYDGSFVELRCGVDKPKWRKKGEEYLNPRLSQIDNYLIMKDVTIQDSGIYQCFGWNEFNDPYQEAIEVIITGNLLATVVIMALIGVISMKVRFILHITILIEYTSQYFQV